MNAYPIPDLALKHILESGLRVIQDEQVDEARKTSVLRALVEIFEEASIGSEAVKARNMLIAIQEPPAFERFALFFKYLNRSVGEELPSRLLEATQVLSAMEKKAVLDGDAKARLADLIQNMLLAITREARLSPLPSPKEFQLSF